MHNTVYQKQPSVYHSCSLTKIMTLPELPLELTPQLRCNRHLSHLALYKSLHPVDGISVSLVAIQGSLAGRRD